VSDVDTPESQRWKRLGKSLLARRVELDLRYRNRRVFADDVGLDYRVLYDIESGRRSNYSDATLHAIERAYQVQAGSIRGVLAGGALEPATPQPGDGARRDATPGPVYSDPAEQKIWEITELPPVVRRQLIGVLRVTLEALEDDGVQPDADVREFRPRA
jgi:hypothetical protein